MRALRFVPLLLLACLVPPDARSRAGESAVPSLPGLHGEVRIDTDRWGIPHVRATDLSDLYCAWGWVTARDRLAQLALTRASARGERHRWLGNSELRRDGGAQLFALRERAEAIWARDRRDPATRMAAERFSDGVNAYLAECRRGTRPWPRELAELHARPDDWRPEDSVALMLGLGVTLDLGLPEFAESESLRVHGAAWFTARHRFEGRWIFDTVPGSGTASAPGASTIDAHASLPAATSRAAAALAADFPAPDAEGATRASNAMVVGARRSASGRPLVANDPHLPLTAPGPLHVIHVSVPGVVEAAGAEVPGLPAIVSGRNTRVAWGITALGADVIDAWADTILADGHTLRGPWGTARVLEKPFDLAYRVLGVDVPLPWMKRRYSPRGPVIVWDAKRRRAISVKWSAMEDERITLRRMLGLERSRDADELVARYRTMVTPTLNVVAADVDGRALYQSVGLVPERATDPGPGVLAADGRHEWTGYVPADSMPAWRVPDDGFAVSGNNRPTASTRPTVWPRYEWAHDRAARMSQRLAGDRSITRADLASVQNDVVSRGSARQVPALLAAVSGRERTLAPRVRQALDSLRTWDFTCRRDRVAPAIARSWWNVFLKRAGCEGLPGLGLAALTGEATGVLHSPGGRPESPADAATGSLVTAVDSLTRLLGPDPGTWRWGRIHRARFVHELAGRFPAARFEPPLTPEDGDGSTVCVGPARAPYDLQVTHGPVYRHVVDLGDSTRSWVVVAPWNSEPAGREGSDLRSRWADHGYVPLRLEWSAIERTAVDRRVFRPGR